MSDSLSYKKSGVDIDAGNALVERIKAPVKSTFTKGVLQGLGGFGALYELPIEQYQRPVLVSGTDGVGTKLKLAHQLNQHNTIGIDLVAMCVNDIVVCGAKPLYFLDYFATAKLDVDQAEQVIQGIVTGCQLAGCALSGGETAEMPGMYQPGDYDLAGFAVGIVEKASIISGKNVVSGDVLIGIHSSGPHSNGYSLIRKIVDHSGADFDQLIDDEMPLGQSLLTPTKIYVKSILSLLEQHPIKSICHVTGGGITENLPRVLPDNVTACINRAKVPFPPIFQWLQQQGNVTEDEMLRTFNCGVGMILCVEKSLQQPVMQCLNALGETTSVLGEISEWQGESICYSV